MICLQSSKTYQILSKARESAAEARPAEDEGAVGGVAAGVADNVHKKQVGSAQELACILYIITCVELDTMVTCWIHQTNRSLLLL